MRATGNRIDVATEMLCTVLGNLAQHQSTIKHFITHSRWSDARETVHKLHGTAIYAGTIRLHESCKKLEVALQTHDASTITLASEDLYSTISELLTWQKSHNPHQYFQHDQDGVPDTKG
jgi:HPt (histidine-containing phosphotransfer) domain-containing protein